MINFTGDATQDNNQPAPDGDYFLTVTDAEEKKSKSGRDMIAMELVVAVGPYADKKTIKHWLTFIEAGAAGHGMTLHALHAFGFPHDGSIQVTAEAFKGRTIKAKVGTEPYKDRLNNVIKDFYILTDEQMAEEGSAVADEAPAAEEVEEQEAPAPAPKPAPAKLTSKPAVAAPARKLPWKK